MRIELTKKQTLATKSKAKFPCYSGGFGNGKTTWLALMAIECAKNHPGSKGVLCRKTYPELRDTIRDEFYKLLPRSAYRRRSDAENICVLKNGSTILFRHLDARLGDLQSLNLDWFGIDQTEEFNSDSEFLLLRGRLRGKHGPRRGFLTCNPEGRGHWIYRRWHKKEGLDEDSADDYEMISATSLENPHLPEDYVKDILRFPEAWKRRYVYGEWDDFSGLIYPEHNADIHIIKPFLVPSHWTKIRTIDTAVSGINACLWTAWSPSGHKFAYREYYMSGLRLAEHAANIIRLSGPEKYLHTVMDPAAWKHTMEGSSEANQGQVVKVAHEWSQYGIHAIPGDNNVAVGINRVGQALLVDPTRYNPITRKNGSPAYFIFENCVHITSEREGYVWKAERRFSEKYEEKPAKVPCHLLDCERYDFLSYTPRGANLGGFDEIPKHDPDRGYNESSRHTVSFVRSYMSC